MTSSKRAAYRESLREDILDVARPLFARAGYNSTGPPATRATAALKRLRIPAKVNANFQAEDEQFSKLLRIGLCLVNQRGPP